MSFAYHAIYGFLANTEQEENFRQKNLIKSSQYYSFDAYLELLKNLLSDVEKEEKDFLYKKDYLNNYGDFFTLPKKKSALFSNILESTTEKTFTAFKKYVTKELDQMNVQIKVGVPTPIPHEKIIALATEFKQLNDHVVSQLKIYQHQTKLTKFKNWANNIFKRIFKIGKAADEIAEENFIESLKDTESNLRNNCNQLSLFKKKSIPCDAAQPLFKNRVDSVNVNCQSPAWKKSRN